MYINQNNEIKVRIKGIDTTVRSLANTSASMKILVIRGIEESARKLMENIKNRFGKYQNSGGTGGGAWEKLAYSTRMTKINKYGFADKPLIATGSMRDSFYVKKGTAGALSASVASTDNRLIFQIYGTKGRRRASPTYSKKLSMSNKRGLGKGRNGAIPPRDPMIVAAEECRDMCNETILAYVDQAIKK